MDILTQKLGTTLCNGNIFTFSWKNEENWPVVSVSENIGQLGYAPDDFISGNLTYSDIVYPGDRDKLKALIQQWNRKNMPCLFLEYRIVDSKGNVRWIAKFVQAQYDEEGILKHLHGTIVDITESKMTELSLQPENEYLRSIVNALREALLVLDTNFKIIFANLSFYKLFRTKPLEIEGLPIYDIENGQWNIPVLKTRMLTLLEDNIEFNDLEIETNFNKIGHQVLLVNSRTMDTFNGKEKMILLAIEDVTESKKSAMELKASEAKYSALVEKGNDGIIIIQGEVLRFTNSKFLELTGYQNEEIINSVLLDHVPIDFRRMLLKRYTKALRDERSIKRNYEVDFIKKNGSTFPAEVSLSFIYYENNPAVMIAIRDIAERKKAEMELKDSEKKYSTLVEKSNDGIVILQNDNLVFANNKFIEIIGYTRTEAIGKMFASFLTIEYRRMISGKFKRNLEKKRQTAYKYEIELLSKIGIKIPVEINSSIIEHEGKPAYMAIIRDITEQKNREKELLKLIEVQKVLENVIESSPAIVFFWKPYDNWPVEFVSENISQFGYTAKEFMSGKMLYGDIIHPYDLEKMNHETLRCIEEGEKNISLEYRILTRSGEVRWIDERSIIKRDAKGRIQYIHGIIVDVTERKNANNFMRIGSELGTLFTPTADIKELFQQFLELVTQVKGIDCGALYLVDEVTGDLNLVAHKDLSFKFVNSIRQYSVNSLHARILKTEYPIYKLYSEISSMTHGSDLGFEGLEATAILPLKYESNVVAVFMLASHTEYAISHNTRSSLESIASQAGPSIGRIREQVHIQKNTNNLQDIFNNIEDFLYVLDINGCILHTNSFLCERLGYSHEKLIGLNIVNLHPQKRAIEVATALSEILAGKMSMVKIPFESYDGKLISAEIKISRGTWDGQSALICLGRERI
ncbi:PAS domain S-box protein [uncultured Methanomethylovorans sp.]|uniref:PAS domain S-box protein n=1 Tax=uncultured Methanomethylovorans sp. TaxID=183759 RepID=UPI002AA645CB|nr:PAS domain S-box protein [uncultured Methanomethylovorans sp.]